MFVFWHRRAATQRWLRLAVGAVVLVAVLGTTLAVGVAARQPDIAVRAALTSASAADGSMVWERQAATGTAAATRDAATRAELRRAFRGADVTISPSAAGDPVPVSGGRAVLPLRDDAVLRSAASGLPALGRGEVAIDEAGARALGVRVGETLRLRTDAGSRALRIVAVWRAADARAPIWNGIGPGAGGAAARAVLAPAELSADHVDLTARWSVAPDPARVRAADLSALEAGYARLAAKADGSTSFARLEGRGAGTVAAMRQGAGAVAAVVPVPLALLGAGALLALLLLVRLLAEVRTDETALLRARGASRAQVAAGDLRAALLPVLGGAAIGGAGAQVLLLLVAPPSGWAELVLPVVVPAAVALLAIGGASVLGAGLNASGAATSGRSGARAGRIAAIAGVALLGLLAIVGVVRLIGAGVGADPAAELAPALLIAALVVAGLLLGPPIAAVADSLARRRGGVAVSLATRRLRRRPGLVAGALVLVALAVAASGFAAGAVTSSTDFVRSAGRLVTGGDLAVQEPGGTSVASGDPSPDAAALTRVAHASAGAPAFGAAAGIGDLEATLAAAPVARLAGLQDPGLAGLPSLGATVGPATGISLTGAGRVRVELDARASAAPVDARVQIRAWLVRADGAAVRLDLPDARIGASTLEARLPDDAPWRLVALDAAVQSSGPVAGLVATVRSIERADGGNGHRVALPAKAWSVVAAITRPKGTTSSGSIGWSVPATLDAHGGRAEIGRLMPAGPSVVPVALSRPLATAAGLGIGSRAQLSAGQDIQIRVTAVVAHAIGVDGPAGVWADLPTLQTALLRTSADVPRADRVWLAVGDPTTAADRIAASDPAATVTASPVATVGPLAAPLTVAAAAAAAGTVLFALLAIAAAVAALVRARRAEIAVLRALGASAGMQRSASRIELAAALGYGAVVGAIAAVVAVAATVPPIAHAMASGAGPDVAAPVRLDPVALGAALVVLLAGVLAGVAGQDRIVARSARRPDAEVTR